MLFYIKKYLSLEIVITLLLGGVGYWQIKLHNFPIKLRPEKYAVVCGLAGFFWLALWTLLAQRSYGIFKGRAYVQNLTATLAKQFVKAGPLQMILGGVTAAFGKEVFFRGFLQPWLGPVPASLLFMAAHFGNREIRVISLWSVFQGLYLGLFYTWTGNLLVPMIAHGPFDIGGMIYFRSFMRNTRRAA